jgi:peptidoglycan endopeptidase LytE
MAVSNLEVQVKLKELGFYKGDLDGLAGKMTAEAVVEFQKSKGLPETGKLDPKSLGMLFPKAESKPKTIKGMFSDYVLNLIKSKSAWASAAFVAFLVSFLQTKFGLTLPPDVVAWVTTGVGVLFAALIGVLESAFQAPHMTTKQPAVVLRPSETVGLEPK